MSASSHKSTGEQLPHELLITSANASCHLHWCNDYENCDLDLRNAIMGLNGPPPTHFVVGSRASGCTPGWLWGRLFSGNKKPVVWLVMGQAFLLFAAICLNLQWWGGRCECRWDSWRYWGDFIGRWSDMIKRLRVQHWYVLCLSFKDFKIPLQSWCCCFIVVVYIKTRRWKF